MLVLESPSNISSVQSYPKVMKHYYSFIDVLYTSHTAFVVQLEHRSFVQLMLTIKEGLNTLSKLFLF